MASTHWHRLSLLAAAAITSFGAQAAEVSISGSFTSFQSALSPYYGESGNGTLNGLALSIDPSLPKVKYSGGDPYAHPQSHTVTLAPDTTEVHFEYTNHIGEGYANLIRFTAADPAEVNFGDTFKVGTLTYTNGFWYPFANVGLSITTSSSNSALDNKNFTGSIMFAVSSPDPYVAADYIANADYFYLQDSSGPLTSLGSVRVYERDNQPPDMPGNTGSVDLYARIGSLVPTSFENPSGGVFLSTSLDPITSAVPEPAAFAMLLAGLGLIGAVVSRRKRAA